MQIWNLRNAKYTAEIGGITGATAYDFIDMSGARASWKEVLAVYTVKTVSDPDNPMEVATVTKTVLPITVTHITPDEMAVQYGFTDEQKEWLEELLKPEYHSLWNSLLYGVSTVGDGSMIGVADTQIGNVDGEPYWSWYGFTSREEWCACFVSWCAEQYGFIDAGIMPRFSGCMNGVQ